MGKEQNRVKGRYYEAQAEAFLKSQGYQILEKNYWTRFGEIDLIAQDGEYLVFVEVKYRSNSQMGFPEEAVTKKKQKTIFRCAQVYLMKKNILSGIPCRFDIVAICGLQVTLLKNAFEGVG